MTQIIVTLRKTAVGHVIDIFVLFFYFLVSVADIVEFYVADYESTSEMRSASPVEN